MEAYKNKTRFFEGNVYFKGTDDKIIGITHENKHKEITADMIFKVNAPA